MTSRREKFSSQPEELPLDLPVETAAREVLDMDKYRAFGSVPRLLGSRLSTLEFTQLEPRAWELTAPAVIEQGLYGREGGTTVNGLVLGAEFYQAIIRNQDSFLASIRAKTVQANRQTSDPRVSEKLYRSQIASLENKQLRHENILGELERRQTILQTLQEMQQRPGYHRHISELELRMMTTTAWESVFVGMIRALKDQYDLSNHEMIDMERAMSYRLLRADMPGKNSQNERIANWGQMLRVGSRYTRAVKTQFSHSQSLIVRGLSELEENAAEFYSQNDISPLGASVLRHASKKPSDS